MVVNGFTSIKEIEAVAIENKDYDNNSFSMPGILFITNLFRKGKQSTKNFTSVYPGEYTRHFDVVILTCGHLNSGLCCMTI
jgi:hypothetical protein